MLPLDEPGTERKIELLQEAIGKLTIVQFFYRGEFRVVEPHALGVSRSWEYLLAAWQIFGTRPGSHCYHVAGMHRLELTDRSFTPIHVNEAATSRFSRLVVTVQRSQD